MKTIILLLVGLTLVLAAEDNPTTRDPTNKGDRHVNELMDKHLKNLKTGGAGEFKKVEIMLIERSLFSEGHVWEVTGKFQVGTETFDCFVKLYQKTWQKPEDSMKITADCGEDGHKKTFTTE